MPESQALVIENFKAITDRLIQWRSITDGVPETHAAYLHALYGTAFDGDQALATWQRVMKLDDFPTFADMDYAQELGNRAYQGLAEIDHYWVEREMLRWLLPEDNTFQAELATAYNLRQYTTDYMRWFTYLVDIIVRITIAHIIPNNTRTDGWHVSNREQQQQLLKIHAMIELYIDFHEFDARMRQVVPA